MLLVITTVPTVKDIFNNDYHFHAGSIRSLAFCIRLDIWMGVGFVYCHSRASWTPNENSKCILYETWAHSFKAADVHRRLPSAETISKWFMFNYSSWVLHGTFHQVVIRVSTCQMRNKPQNYLSKLLLFVLAPVFACFKKKTTPDCLGCGKTIKYNT